MSATSYRVRIKDRSQLPGRVSLRVAAAIIGALQVALGAEAATMNIRKPSRRGRLSKLARESIGLSLVAIEHGSGTMVWEPDTASLIDLPSQVFEDFIAESHRKNDATRRGNIGIQKALLSLGGLFQADPSVETIEFIDSQNRVGIVNTSTIERIRLALTEPMKGGGTVAHRKVTGRLLELDLVNQSFELHAAQGKSIVAYDDFLEPVVMNALKRFVVADVQKETDGRETLLSVTAIADVPESRFDEVRKLNEIIEEQGLAPIIDFASLAMTELEDSDTATLEDFTAFIRSARHDEAC